MGKLTAIFTGLLCTASLIGTPGVAAAQSASEQEQASGGVTRFAYTSLDLEKCETVETEAAALPEWVGPVQTHRRCEGLTADWPVHVLKGELWITVSYGPDALNEPAAVPHFQSERIGGTLEWVQAGEPGKVKPVATIVRFFTLSGEKADLREHPILVVTQLKPGAVCPIALIDARANENANRDAREAALRLAGSFNCEGEPELVGPQSAGVFAE